jgi:hypothetical protein
MKAGIETAAGTRQHTLKDPAAGSAKIADEIHLS